jgi:hypothetical protein
MRSALKEFAALYAKRPIQDNTGGMSSTHLFLFWFILRRLQPRFVIESGVWKGQGTWLIEQACPDAEIFCIDIDWSHLEYRSSRAKLLNTDFSRHDWRHLPKAETLVFFDDHIDAIERCRVCIEHGFRHVVFEDNYPPGKGDVYSLFEVFENAGHKVNRRLRLRLSRMLGRLRDRDIPANTEDSIYLRGLIEVYDVMPPIFKLERTRWGDQWDDAFPTPEPLLEKVSEDWQRVYFDEAKWYTWLCYVRLRNHTGLAMQSPESAIRPIDVGVRARHTLDR